VKYYKVSIAEREEVRELVVFDKGMIIVIDQKHQSGLAGTRS
jgi:hypothetical protein